jgi:hypothetical protein
LQENLRGTGPHGGLLHTENPSLLGVERPVQPAPVDLQYSLPHILRQLPPIPDPRPQDETVAMYMDRVAPFCIIKHRPLNAGQLSILQDYIMQRFNMARLKELIAKSREEELIAKSKEDKA